MKLAAALALTLAMCNTARAADDSHLFDFLIGEWSLQVKPKVNSMAALFHGAPEWVGAWTGSALPGGGVEDDYRVSDASGNPIAAVHSERRFDAEREIWTVTSEKPDHADRWSSHAATLADGVELTGERSTADGKTFRFRVRFQDIDVDGFVAREERSFDGGASWEEAVVVYATRPGASPD